MQLSVEIQGPILEEHLTYDDAKTMNVEELTNFAEKFYTADDIAAWREMEEYSDSLVIKHQVEPSKLANDVWSMLKFLQDAEYATGHH